MCQIFGIWHIWHTKHKNGALLNVLNVSNFCNMLQYRCNFDTVQTRMANVYIIFLFIFLSPPITCLSLYLQHISLSLYLVLSSPILPTLCFVLTPFSVSVHLSQIGVEGVKQWGSAWMGHRFDVGAVGRGFDV